MKARLRLGLNDTYLSWIRLSIRNPKKPEVQKLGLFQLFCGFEKNPLLLKRKFSLGFFLCLSFILSNEKKKPSG